MLPNLVMALKMQYSLYRKGKLTKLVKCFPPMQIKLNKLSLSFSVIK